MPFAILLNIEIFLGALGALLVLLILVSTFHRPAKRPCINCEGSVEIQAKKCPHCGYRFVWFRMGR